MSGSAPQIFPVEEGADPVGAVDGEQRHGHAVEQGLGEEQQWPDGEVIGTDNVPGVGAAHPHQQGVGEDLDRNAERPPKKGGHEQIDEEVAGQPGPAP